TRRWPCDSSAVTWPIFRRGIVGRRILLWRCERAASSNGGSKSLTPSLVLGYSDRFYRRLLALGDLRRARFLRLCRLGGGEGRGVLHRREVLPRQRLEVRGILAGPHGAHRELLGQRIDRPAAAVELVMQVRTGRQAGRADEADHLALAHHDAGLDAGTQPRHVRAGGG